MPPLGSAPFWQLAAVEACTVIDAFGAPSTRPIRKALVALVDMARINAGAASRDTDRASWEGWLTASK
jgi:hypothetical protein